MTVLWPAVKAKLVEALPGLAGFEGVKVFDGPVVTGQNPPRYVTVGWQPSTDDTSAGSFEQTPGPSGFSAAEEGTVLLEVASLNGATDVMDGFGMVVALTSWVQANQTLDGVLSANGTASTSVEVVEAQSRVGATQRLLVTVAYTSWV